MPKFVSPAASHPAAASMPRERTTLPYARPLPPTESYGVPPSFKRLHPEMLAHLKGALQHNPRLRGPEVDFLAAGVAADGRLDDVAVQQAQQDAYQGRLPTFGNNAAYATYLPNMFVRDAALFVAAGPMALHAARKGMGMLLFMVQAAWDRTTPAEKQGFAPKLPERQALLELFEFARAHGAILEKSQALYTYEVLVLPLMALFADGGLPAVERGYFCIKHYAYGPIASYEIPRLADIVRLRAATLLRRGAPSARPRPQLRTLPAPSPTRADSTPMRDVIRRLEALALVPPRMPRDTGAELLTDDEAEPRPGFGRPA